MYIPIVSLFRRLSLKVPLSLFFIAWFNSSISQSLPIPPPSPLQTVKQQFATSFIEISYSRPGVKGRRIFGELVPFGKVWRTGANAATTIEFGEDITIDQVKVEKGKYGLLSIPGEKEWQIIITKDLNITSAQDYKIENDVVRIPAKAEKLCEPVETFTIEIQNIKPTQADIQLKWESTKVAFSVLADIDEKIMKAIDKELAADRRPFHQAANYYYENNKDLNKALEWSTKAVENNPNAYWMSHLKSKILFKLKDYPNALSAAEFSMAKAREAKSEEYVKMNQKLIEEIKSQPDFRDKTIRGKKK
jgi:hypothetical protein